MNDLEFDWDEGNINHVIQQYPERGNTIEEVESIFLDKNFIGDFDREDPRTGELRYWGMGIGTQGILKYVVYVERIDKIRPITCYVAKRNQRHLYHERANTTPKQEDSSGT